jgi:hypothetical protein
LRSACGSPGIGNGVIENGLYNPENRRRFKTPTEN